MQPFREVSRLFQRKFDPHSDRGGQTSTPRTNDYEIDKVKRTADDNQANVNGLVHRMKVIINPVELPLASTTLMSQNWLWDIGKGSGSISRFQPWCIV
jgi:hypothetical protein